MEFAKTYTPELIEKKWYSQWEDSGAFKPQFKSDKNKNFCIQLPPPNVTGTLHMGHGFQQTLMDILTRYHRMRGYNTLWQPGVDHAGIATQMVVERQLEAQNQTKDSLGREAFIKKVWQWKEESGHKITDQMKRLGVSCDWSREAFTMNDEFNVIVKNVFVSLYDKGYIYRGKRLVNWDTKLQTAVSDLEVVATEENGNLWHIRYPLVGKQDEFLVVATTRPETMLGDVAVAVNGDDKRYCHLIGQKLSLPLVGREIPIIADDYVDPLFGTGCVKITPAHDFNDNEVGARHHLEMINIMTLNGEINQNAPEKYRGMDRFVCRKAVIADLEALGLLESTKPHKLMVPRGDRSGSVIEPLLTDQWFLNMDQLAKNALKLVADGEVSFVPENWTNIYNQWLNDIREWCISRQLWWGHQIPAYYDKDGNCYVAKSLEDAITLAKTDDLTQDPDVLDTWFSSALWSFATLGWPSDTKELQAFLPSSVLITGYDIIFFWVARMIMLTHEFTGKVPFKEVFVTGLILDANGQKMSKSKGNTIDPIDLIDGIKLDDLIQKRTYGMMNPKLADNIAKITKRDYPGGFTAFGTDALRFSFALIATNNREIRFDVRKIEAARNFCNKLWNASRFALMTLESHGELVKQIDKSTTLEKLVINSDFINNWIIKSLNQLIADLELAYKTYRFDIAAQKLYEFVWNDFCDWYLELAKVNFESHKQEVQSQTATTLLLVLECVLRLLHPFIPFISEELWQIVAPICGKKETDLLITASYPDRLNLDSAISDERFAKLQLWVASIRNLRATMNLGPGQKVPLKVEGVANEQTLGGLIPYIKNLAKISDVTFVDKLAAAAPTALVGNIAFMLEVTVDIGKEKARFKHDLAKAQQELEKLQAKLGNEAFVAKAPEELVTREKIRADELKNLIKNLEEQLIKLG